MHELYIVIDDTDNPADVTIERCPVLSLHDPHEGVPDAPCRVLPPLEAYVKYKGEERRVVLSVNAAEDLNVALRLAFRKLDRYISDGQLQIIEAQRTWAKDPKCVKLATACAQKTLNLTQLLEGYSKAATHLYAKVADYSLV